MLVVHQCRHCGVQFNDDEWQLRCNAPHVELTSRGSKKPQRTDTITHFDSLDEVPENMRKIIEGIQKKRGLV